MGKGKLREIRDLWNDFEAEADERKELGPKSALTTRELRNRMHGFTQLTLTLFNTKTKDWAQVEAVNINTEATLLLIDKLDAYMAAHPNSSKEVT